MSARDEASSNDLREALRLKKRPPVTRQDVEEFLSAPGSAPETVERVRALFVEKSFLRIHRRPVRQIRDLRFPSFGVWVAEAREKARLTRIEVAKVLKQETAFIERLESGETPPWRFDVDAVAGLVRLCRLHIDAVESLIRNTEGSTLPPASPPPTHTRPQAEGTRTFMLDQSGPSPQFRPEVAHWLRELRAALERLQADDLLSS